MQFCLEVLGKLGLNSFAIGQAERIWISAARKLALGARDMSVTVKPQAAPTVVLEKVGVAGNGREPDCQLPDATLLKTRIEAAFGPGQVQNLRSRGIVKLSGVMSPLESITLCRQLSQHPSALGPETFLRESSGNGKGGAYQAIKSNATLRNLNSALATICQQKMDCGPLGGNVLLTRYGNGGLNYLHQDQTTQPYQAYLLLSEPSSQFCGGEVYLRDPADKSGAEVQEEWRGRGELLLFAANSTAVGAADVEKARGCRSNFYHGVREVREAAREKDKEEDAVADDTTCLMVLVGLME